MMPFNLLAFTPFFILLGVAGIGGGISAWIRFAPSGKRPRARPRRSAEILIFSPRLSQRA